MKKNNYNYNYQNSNYYYQGNNYQPPQGYAPQYQGAYYPGAQNQQYQQYAPQYAPQYVYPFKKQHRPFSKKDNRFVYLFLLATFLFVDFALFKGFHLGFSIAYSVMFIIASVFVWNKGAKPSVFSLTCGALSLAGAATFSLFSNYLVNAIMFFLVCGLFTLYCMGISGSFNRKQGNFKVLFDLGAGALIYPFKNFGDVIGSVKAGGKRKKNISAFVGVILALPLLLIIVPLLVESDAAFQGLVETIAKNIGLYIIELVVAGILLPYVFSFMFGKKYRLNNNSNSKGNSISRKLPVSGCVSFMCVISLTYAIYLFSQLAYFFSAFKGILPEDYTGTESEFARRGFFEMFAICAINIAIISFINAFAKRNSKGKNAAAIKAMSLFISLFSVLLLATAMQKMRLNISTYGFTANRLLVSAFMVMMFVVIAFFIVHIFAPKLSYMQAIIILCSCIFIALSFANIDALTAEYNIKAYESGATENLDMEALSDLGDAGIPYLIHLTGDKDALVAHKARVALANKVSLDEGKHVKLKDSKLVASRSDFRSYCKSSDEAWAAFLKYYSSLDKNDEFNFILKIRMTDKGYYDEWDDSYYDYDSGKSYSYNEETNKYEEVEEEYDFEFDLEDDYDYDEDI